LLEITNEKVILHKDNIAKIMKFFSGTIPYTLTHIYKNIKLSQHYSATFILHQKH